VAGAWYGSVCETCPLFPCHDALMALRLTADLRLQFCLLREDITVALADLLNGDGRDLEAAVRRALDVYAGATFHPTAPKVPVAVVAP
jgi:cyclic pyranopterin phosphate synthase